MSHYETGTKYELSYPETPIDPNKYNTVSKLFENCICKIVNMLDLKVETKSNHQTDINNDLQNRMVSWFDHFT